MMKSYKYRLYPTKKQVEQFEWTLDRCRELYNAALQERKEAWEVCKRHPNYYDIDWRKEHARAYSISCFDQQRSLTVMRHEVRPEYEQIGAHVLRNVLKRVDLAFQAFFRRVKSGEKAGYPRFQGKNRYDSFTYPDTQGLVVGNKKITLSKIGQVEIKLHRPIQGTIKACMVEREGDQWYVCFACEVEPVKRTPYTDEMVGIDLGILKLATLSTGDVIENPKHYRKAEKRLARLQQSLSCKKRGSTRRRKAVKRVAKAHRKIHRQRKDYLHKWSCWLVDTYETIVFEDIKPANLSRTPKPKQDETTGQHLPNKARAKAGLNKSILDAGWTTFIAMCEYKAECAGAVQVIKVDPKYTSQVCSSCGAIRKKDLSERWHSCECGCELDRDHNAALNIFRLGKSLQSKG